MKQDEINEKNQNLLVEIFNISSQDEFNNFCKKEILSNKTLCESLVCCSKEFDLTNIINSDFTHSDCLHLAMISQAARGDLEIKNPNIKEIPSGIASECYSIICRTPIQKIGQIRVPKLFLSNCPEFIEWGSRFNEIIISGTESPVELSRFRKKAREIGLKTSGMRCGYF